MDEKVIIVAVVLIVSLYLVWIGKKSDKKSSTNPDIKSATFNLGVLPSEKFKAASLCNDKVLYPINSLDVDYGSKMKDCPCNQFLASP